MITRFHALFVFCVFYGTKASFAASNVLPSTMADGKDFASRLASNGYEQYRTKEQAEFYSKVHNVPIQDEHAEQLMQHWIDKGLSSLFSVFANERLKSQPKPVHNEFQACTKHATTVSLHAKCVSRLMDGEFTGKSLVKETVGKSQRFEQYRQQKKAKLQRSFLQDNNKEVDQRHEREHPPKNWKGRLQALNAARKDKYMEVRRARRHTVTKQNYYRLLSPESERGMSPIGGIAKILMSSLLTSKNKTEKDVVHWQQVIDRVQAAAKKRKELTKKLDDKAENLDSMDQLAYKGLKEHSSLTMASEIDDLQKNPKKLKEFVNKHRKQRLQKPLDRLLELLRSGVQLGYNIAGQNGTVLEDKSLKMISPRFLSVVPEEDPDRNETINLLSPSLFSMHNEGRGIENLTSLPNLIKGFSRKDQQLWLDFIVEAAGILEHTERLEKELSDDGVVANSSSNPMRALPSGDMKKFREQYEREIRNKDGVPLYFTKENVTAGFGEKEAEKITIFEKLHFSTDRDQIHEMNRTGFTILRPDQLELVYGPESPLNDSALLQKFLSMDRSQIMAALEHDIRLASEAGDIKMHPKEIYIKNNAVGQHHRSKRHSAIALSPLVLVPIILSPQTVSDVFIILSPLILTPVVLSPSLFGPIILSPAVFFPLILSPRVGSPLILTPIVFTPFILTPMVLHPFILVPGVFNPAILSPLVLSPLVLSPQVFTPLVLSPLVLTPLILTPMVGSPLVLSPFVLSPIIASPQVLGALVLSPYALSPIIASPLSVFETVLSPSYLS